MRITRILLACVAALFLASPGIAHADTTASESPSSEAVYVYWSYWTAQPGKSWIASPVGAGSTTPANGSVEGWRYGTGTATDTTQQPSDNANFAALCGSTKADPGNKLVAVVVNFGTAAVAPSGTTPPAPINECANVPTSANGIQVLQAVADVRTSSEGMVCGVNGYPPSGCGEQVSANGTVDGTATNTSSSSSLSPAIAIGGAIAIIVIVVAGIVIARRRGNA